MELTLHIDNEQVHDLIITSLKEYHKYLAEAEWVEEEQYRIKAKEAFEIVLEQYMTPSKYKEYITLFIN